MAKMSRYSWNAPKEFVPDWSGMAMANCRASICHPEDDVAYFRAMAHNMLHWQNQPRKGYNLPSEDDIFEPTATELLEMADEIECGFEEGEFM